jgi:hypothetical protein
MKTIRRPTLVVVLGLVAFGCARQSPAEGQVQVKAEEQLERVEVAPYMLADEYPMGDLGFRVGTYLEIEGVRDTGGMVGDSNLLVDTIRGEKIDVPVSVLVENVRELPLGRRCVIRGYESVRMIGLPEQVAEAENLPPTQALWQMQRFFVMTSAMEPKDLEAATPARFGGSVGME